MDRIKKYLAYDGRVAISVIESTELVEDARKIHDLTPTTTAALGRLLTGAALMGAELKNESDSVTVQIKGDGPAGSLIAVTDFVPRPPLFSGNPCVYRGFSTGGLQIRPPVHLP